MKVRGVKRLVRESLSTKQGFNAVSIAIWNNNLTEL